jgi:hypothetical protein
MYAQMIVEDITVTLVRLITTCIDTIFKAHTTMELAVIRLVALLLVQTTIHTHLLATEAAAQVEPHVKILCLLVAIPLQMVTWMASHHQRQ